MCLWKLPVFWGSLALSIMIVIFLIMTLIVRTIIAGYISALGGN